MYYDPNATIRDNQNRMASLGLTLSIGAISNWANKYCSVFTDVGCVPQYDYLPSSDICTYSNTSDIPDIDMPEPSSFNFGTVQFPDWWTGMQQKQGGHLMDVVSFSLLFFIVYVCSIDNTTTYYNQLRQTYRK